MNLVVSLSMKTVMNYIRQSGPIIFVGVPLILGIVYAIHNTDTHHWWFILGTALDYHQGRSFFTEVYVQYGLGINYIIHFLGKFIPITYSNPGIFMSIIYSGTLLLIYLSMRQISSVAISSMISLLALLIHPYSIYPWPDYLAGFTLALAVYILVKYSKINYVVYFIIGALFFLSFLFRSTYIINIAATGGLFFICNIFNKRLFHPGIYCSYLVFLFCIGIYLSILYYQGNAAFWYAQAIGAAGKSYGVNSMSGLSLLKNIANPNMVETFIFSGLFLFCLIFVAFGVFVRSFIDVTSDSNGRVIPVIVFLSILGITGFVQCTMIFEVFRLQNACSPLFVSSAFWLHLLSSRYDFSMYNFQIRSLAAVLILMVVINFPAQLAGKWGSTYWPIIEPPFLSNWKKYVTISSIPIFTGHRLMPDVELYYSGLANKICEKSGQVVNLTRDPLIPYLCGYSKSALFLPMFSEKLIENISPSQLIRIRQGRFRKGELIVYEETSDKDQMLISIFKKTDSTVNLCKLGEWVRPKSIRWLTTTRVSLYESLSGY